MQELAPAHLTAGDRRHDTVVLVDHVYQFVSGIHGGRNVSRTRATAFSRSCAPSLSPARPRHEPEGAGRTLV